MGRLNEVVLTGIVDEEKRELVKVSANGLAANIPLVNTNPLTGGDVLSASGKAYGLTVTPLTNTSAGIQQAIDSLAMTGGTVELQPITYTFTEPVTLRESVSLRGTAPMVSTTTHVPEITWDYVGGTILQGDGTFDGLIYNTTDRGTSIAAFSSDALYNVTLKGFGVKGFTRGIAIGAVNAAGMMFGSIEDVYYKDCSVWGIELQNFIYCQFKKIFGRVTDNSTAGGQHYVCSVPLAVLICGNSTWENVFSWSTYRLNRGIVWEQKPGCQLNEMNTIRAQVNKNGETKASQAATFTNGSPNIGVANSAVFPVGIPVSFTTSGNGFVANQTYFVRTSAANVITLANVPVGGSVVNSTGTTGLTIETGGFPNFEVITNQGEYMGNTRLMGIDAESINSISFLGCGLSGFVVDMQETSSGALQNIVLRAATDTVVHAVKPSVKTDFDNGAAGTRYFGGATRAVTGQPGHGYWNSKWQSGGSPSIAAAAAAGTGATASSSYSNNDCGAVSITTGTSPTTGIIATVTATTLAGFAVYCPTITPTNAAANALSGAAKVRVQTSVRGTGFDFVVDTALAPSTTYTFNYRI